MNIVASQWGSWPKQAVLNQSSNSITLKQHQMLHYDFFDYSLYNYSVIFNQVHSEV